MAITEDMEFPRLTPPGDRLPSGHRLFRSPEDLTDEQFDLLAAAWAGDSLSGDSLSEAEEAIAASSERRIRAESFRQIRLSPLNDRWVAGNRMLKPTPGSYAISRTLIVTIAVAAAVGAIVILGPLTNRPDNQPAGPPVAEAQTMGEALIAEASPVIMTAPAEGVTLTTQDGKQVEEAASSFADAVNDPETVTATADSRERAYLFAGIHDFAGAVPILAATPEASRLMPVEMNNIIYHTAPVREESWIVRGLSLLAEAITKEKQSVDGYYIANACINGVNRVLGWEMALDQEKNDEGEKLATNFSSSLLTFTAPVKKSHQ